jgi:hypothetical protein
MGGINVTRWLLGGIAAAAIIWLCEGAGSMLYSTQMAAVLQAHNLPAMEMRPNVMAMSVVISLIAGLTLVFFYAATRPRLGPGPRSAAKVACAVWVGGYVLSLLGYAVLGLFPTWMLVVWGAVGLVELNIAALVGGTIYRDV